MTDKIRKTLFDLKDLEYKNFHSKLIPNMSPERILGIRTPVLRQYAKRLYESQNIKSFLSDLPHKYYEENNLHAFLIEQMSDFSECIDEVNSFLPYIDNWATCDSLRPKCFAFNLEKLFAQQKNGCLLLITILCVLV